MREFQVFVKPAGAVCNMACGYCYYLKKEQLYPDHSFRMADGLVENYIVQHIQTAATPVISFCWHGGEPTVLGLDYFKRIVALQHKHQPPGRRIMNGIQTNGILLDEEWCRFLSQEGFGVGLSLDGPPELHDLYRVTRGGGPTHRETMRAFELLRRYRVPCDLLCVVHDQSVTQPMKLYRFFRQIGSEYVGFLPVVERVEGAVSAHSVRPEALGAFLCTIFDEWLRRDVGRITFQFFDEASRPARGLEHSLCIFRETCGDIPVIEHNGDFYCCDHFVDEKHRLGNIGEKPLADLLDSPAQIAFGRAKLDALPRYCRMCGVRSMCNGGCPKDRFIETPDGEPGLNYLCAGLKRFFEYARPQISRLASQSGSPVSADRITRVAPKISRNDPCPCGSGRKYKKCCGAGS